MQTLSTAKGRAELAGSDHPRFASERGENAAVAHTTITQAIKQVQELQGILRQPNNWIPVDTRYRGEGGDRNKDFINLPTDNKDRQPLSAQTNPTSSKP